MMRTLITISLAVFLAGCTRSQRAQVVLTGTTYTNQVRMQAGDSFEFHLPSGKTVAVWCVRPKTHWIFGAERTDAKSGLKTFWGERPFKKPGEVLQKIGTNCYAVVGWKSYITQFASLVEGDTARHYELLADGLRFSIVEDLKATNSLPVTIQVRRQ